jgi:hypothetical protein
MIAPPFNNRPPWTLKRLKELTPRGLKSATKWTTTQAFPIGHPGRQTLGDITNTTAILPSTSIPTRNPQNDPGVPDRPLWPTLGDITAKRPCHPQPPFQHAARTLLSSKTTQAFPIGHSGRQSVTPQQNGHTTPNLHSNTQPTPCCHQKRPRRSRPATPADSR